MNVALIGYGYWGKVIEKYITNDDVLKLKYIFSRSEYKHPLYTNSYETILLDKSVEAVFICTPISTHYKLCEQALIYGKNVFCEKPTVKNKIELEHLISLAQKNKCVLYTDYIYTVSPTINYIKNNIGRIGNILSIIGRIERFLISYPDDNVYEVLGVHLLSAIYYITQEKSSNIIFKDLYRTNNAMIGTINYYLSGGTNVEIFCSMVSDVKVSKIQFLGELGKLEFSLNSSPTCKIDQWTIDKGKIDISSEFTNDFNEDNGLINSIEEFKFFVSKYMFNSNIDIALEVVEVLNEYNFCTSKAMKH